MKFLLWVACLSSVFSASTPFATSAQARDTSYAIDAGTYSGIIVATRQATATRRGSNFWRLASHNDRRIVGWNPSHFPVGVAFRPNRGISADDSTAFWKILGQMQLDLGVQIFRAASIAHDDEPDGVIVVDTKAMSNDEGVTYITWSGNGAVYDARVFFRSPAKLHEAGVVTHEMMHALGFGHTSAWSSIMSATPLTPRLTETDVAYAQIALRDRARSESVDLWERLALAAERETPPSVPVPTNNCASAAALPIEYPLPSASCSPERK
ncbi:MAG: hypothetical protein ABJC63_00600, partial [Gemmatimonadales bacterium]